MSKVKIETLSAIHIGNGVMMQYGTDFIYGKDLEGYDVISVISPEKVLSLIGNEHMSNWLAAIDRKEPIDNIVKQFAPKSSIEDYSRRIIQDCASVKKSDTLKELIHDGMGKPYIPGSSIKGAIRTAIFATIAHRKDNLDKLIAGVNKQGEKKKPNASKVESLFFGQDTYSNIFRFLVVGDAIFGDNYEIAVRMVNINERTSKGFWDESKQQLIEAIAQEDSSIFQMKIKEQYYDFCKSQWPASAKFPIGCMPDEMHLLSSLFQLINAHTKSLVESEIEYWEIREDSDNSDKVSEYIGKMKDILDAINSCEKGKDCVLRIGHGSGWRFITGAWTESLDNFASDVIPASRPNDKSYSQYDFPKTRRVDTQCDLLGFVKLSLQN